MIIINGKSYNGNSVSISNGKIIIDGNNVTPENAKQISIVVNGDIDNLNVDYCEKIEVAGNVATLQSTSGNVDVKGDANSIQTTSGDVDVEGNIKGSVTTMSGDVDCQNIGGTVKTMSGDIKYRK
jgi:hypothetical protein